MRFMVHLIDIIRRRRNLHCGTLRFKLRCVCFLLRNFAQRPPGARDARSLASPPEVDVVVVLSVRLVVQQGAHAAHEVGVDELAGALPPAIIFIYYYYLLSLLLAIIVFDNYFN